MSEELRERAGRVWAGLAGEGAVREYDRGRNLAAMERINTIMRGPIAATSGGAGTPGLRERPEERYVPGISLHQVVS